MVRSSYLDFLSERKPLCTIIAGASTSLVLRRGMLTYGSEAPRQRGQAWVVEQRAEARAEALRRGAEAVRCENASAVRYRWRKRCLRSSKNDVSYGERVRHIYGMHLQILCIELGVASGMFLPFETKARNYSFYCF